MTIRVALDITPEITGTTGVARYSRELRRALEQRTDCQLLTFAVGRGAEPSPPGARRIRTPLRVVQALWRTLGRPRAEDWLGALDVVHSLDLVPPPTRRPLVITVHDMVTAERPDLHTARSQRMQTQQFEALSRAAVILAVSNSTAAALESGGIERHRIRVAANGLAVLPAHGASNVEWQRFLLVVGTLEPRKGHDLLLRALADAPPDDLRIVFAGPTVGREVELSELASSLGLGTRLRILGRVEDGELARLYRDATLLCLPSLGEGFGLPVLEAMAAGLPVVASDLPAIREVAGGAAILVDPVDANALRSAIAQLWSDEDLRRRLAERGRTRAELFSWAKTAETTVQAYHHALETARGPREGSGIP